MARRQSQRVGLRHRLPDDHRQELAHWTKRRDSDAVHEIASFNNLDAVVETTKEKLAQIEQNQESDWEF